MTYIVIHKGKTIARFPLLDWAHNWAEFWEKRLKLQGYEVKRVDESFRQSTQQRIHPG